MPIDTCRKRASWGLIIVRKKNGGEKQQQNFNTDYNKIIYYEIECSMNFSHTFDFLSENLQVYNTVVQCIFPCECAGRLSLKHSGKTFCFLFVPTFFSFFVFIVAATITLSNNFSCFWYGSFFSFFSTKSYKIFLAH